MNQERLEKKPRINREIEEPIKRENQEISDGILLKINGP